MGLGYEVDKRWGVDSATCELIEVLIAKGVDASPLTWHEYSYNQAHEISYGLFHGLDVSVFSTSRLSWCQMRELRIAMMDGLDVSAIAKPHFGADKMRRAVALRKTGMEWEQALKLIDEDLVRPRWK
jgi:hypothetical protein